MTDLILTKDTEAHFPHFTVLKASAGSGKTHTLTKRFVQFLLSENIPRNRLRNLLAITFSNNAAKEMKERSLSWLKEVHFGDLDKLGQLLEITSLSEEEMKGRPEFSSRRSLTTMLISRSRRSTASWLRSSRRRPSISGTTRISISF